jgi:choline dehydrogenase-like flavoprotein
VSDLTTMWPSGGHPTGTASMARTVDEGVCDTNQKVFGLDNLYLASGAVFPHSGAAAPTLTIAAIALRLADHLEPTTRKVRR